MQLTKLTLTEYTVKPRQDDDMWTVTFTITGGLDNSHEILLSPEYNDSTRLTVVGITPRGKNRQYVRVYVPSATGGWDEFKFSSIGVSAKKTAEQIAKDIVRRFLPNYRKAVILVRAKIAADEKYAADKRANLEACARTLNATLRSDYRDIRGCDAVYEPLGSFHSNIGDTIRIEVKASANDVDVDIDNLTVEQAKAVLQFIKAAF